MPSIVGVIQWIPFHQTIPFNLWIRTNSASILGVILLNSSYSSGFICQQHGTWQVIHVITIVDCIVQAKALSCLDKYFSCKYRPVLWMIMRFMGFDNVMLIRRLCCPFYFSKIMYWKCETIKAHLDADEYHK